MICDGQTMTTLSENGPPPCLSDFRINEPSEYDAGERQHAQRSNPRLPSCLAKPDRLRRQARSRLGKDQCDDKRIHGIKAGEPQARMKAPSYMSPTDLPRYQPSRSSTSGRRK